VRDCAPDVPQFAPALIQTADLNGDGVNDYVLSAFAYSCRGDSPYCGSAGCEVQIFLSAPGQLLEQRFSGHLQEPPRIVRRGGTAMLISGDAHGRVTFTTRAAAFVPDKQR
jgi:hypothetical protein